MITFEWFEDDYHLQSIHTILSSSFPLAAPNKFLFGYRSFLGLEIIVKLLNNITAF